MLGNDIVDYSVDHKKYQEPRYIGRILNENEADHLSQSSDKNAFLWSLWAAKEASFKAQQKRNFKTIFSPSQFILDKYALEQLSAHDYTKPLNASLSFHSQNFKLFYSWPTNSCVHCLATTDSVLAANDIQSSCAMLQPEETHGNQSQQVRMLAQKLFRNNQITAQIERPAIAMSGYSKPGPPILVGQHNERLPHDISLSHHGEWLAVALLLKG